MKDGVAELEITQFTAGGYGLARTDQGVVLVRGALPGERVTGRPRVRDGVLKAHAIDILRRHPARVALPLPPGADLPLEYEAQLPLKEGLVREALERVGKIQARVQTIARSPRELGYRTAAQYAVAPAGMGARAFDSDAIVPLTVDLLACRPINDALASFEGKNLHGVSEVAFRASLLENRVVAGLLGDSRAIAERHARTISVDGVSWGRLDRRGRFRGRTAILKGAESLTEDFGGVKATVTVQSFAQVNPLAAGLLYGEAAAIAGSGTRALDVYAGSGVLGMHLAKSFDEVIAVEISPDAVRHGKSDARRSHVANLHFKKGDARLVSDLLPADLVALDPPRAGLSRDVVGRLSVAAPRRILYVSCDPATWARDMSVLAEAGYRLTFVRPYDFYPYTHHVEVLSLLER